MAHFVTKETLTAALKEWNSLDGTQFLAHLQLVKTARQHQSAETYPTACRRITNDVLLEQIKQLSEHSARLLTLHYMNGEPNQATANELKIAIASFYRHRDKAIAALISQINHAETALRRQLATDRLDSIPPSQTDEIFGAVHLQDVILAQLCQSDHPHQIVLTGLGGLGKTTQLKAILQRLVYEFVYDHFIWTEISYAPTGQQSCVAQVLADIRRYMTRIGLPPADDEQMRLWFLQSPCLLIIDNVEDETDANSLLKTFETWLNPSKLIMTSRAVATRHKHVFVQSLNELTSTDAHALIRHLAQIGGYSALHAADEETLNDIYQRTGGNPLAIELVIGLLQSLPLPAILDDLPVANLVETSEVYARIYRRVWDCLSTDGKRLFKMMPLIGAHGAQPKQMQAVTKLKNTSFWAAVSELTSRSLLIQKGNELKPRYGIHRISEQFLKVEVIRWP